MRATRTEQMPEHRASKGLDYLAGELAKLIAVFEMEDSRKVAAIRIYDSGDGYDFDLEFSGYRKRKRGDAARAKVTVRA